MAVDGSGCTFYFEGLTQIILEFKTVFLQLSVERSKMKLNQFLRKLGHNMYKRGR